MASYRPPRLGKGQRAELTWGYVTEEQGPARPRDPLPFRPVVTGPRYEPFDAETWRDPYPLYARLREEDPVHYAAGLDTWVLTRFADVQAAALDPGTFSSTQGLTFVDEHELVDLLPTMVMMDPPKHTAYRRLVNRGFAPRRVADIEPALRDFVRSCVERLRSGASTDLVEALARPVPCFVVAHYLGVPAEDRSRFALS